MIKRTPVARPLMRFALSAVATLGCASQTLTMERTSSGAVERDVDFTPGTGTDGHFISLPAYPLANCVDTLVSDLHLPPADPRAGDVGATPCSSSPRYRGFLGYLPGADSAKVSWIDTPQPEQSAALAQIRRLIAPNALDAKWPTALLSFFHFSDVQIREPNAKLGGSALSHQLKQLVSTFEQDYEQEQYALYVYDAIVETARAEFLLAKAHPGDRPPPMEMIHTGDSADTGLQSEFDTFITYTNKLPVPWYQVIGNHDVLAFGNLRLTSRNGPDRPDADHYQGPGWKNIDCTCTSLDALVRNFEIPQPDNLGTTTTDLPSQLSPMIPFLLERICLVHTVAADWFVMDPDKHWGKSASSSVNSFILSHCAGRHPKPGEANQPGLDREGCREQGEAAEKLRPEYVLLPDKDKLGPMCGVLPEMAPPGSPPNPPRTALHGFDLYPPFWAAPESDHRGYYCFELKMANQDHTPRRAWAVVLNTNSVAGAYGYVDDKQLSWLAQVLNTGACGPTTQSSRAGGPIGCNDLVMVFAHHPIWSIYDQSQRLRLTQIVTQSPNVIGYFAGHTHDAGLRVIHPVGGQGQAKWEIVAPSVIDYPQAARQVTVKSSDGLGYIEILTFNPSGSGPSVAKIKAAEMGAIRDTCLSHPEKCVNGRVRLPGREVTFPRLFFRMPGSASLDVRSVAATARTSLRP